MHDLTVYGEGDEKTFVLSGKLGPGEICRIAIEPLSSIDDGSKLYVVRAATEMPDGRLGLKQGNFVYDAQPSSPLRLLHEALKSIMEDQL